MYLYPYWKKEIIDVFGTNRGKYNESIVNGGIGCLNENTRVATSVGLVTLKYLSELPSVKLAEGIKALLERVFVVSEQGSNEIQLVKDKGLSRTVLLRFKSGRTVEGTVDHKFRVLDKGTIVWKRLEDVLVGDKFHLNTERKVFGRECLDEDELHSLGALFGNARVRACGNLGVLWCLS